MKIVRVSIIFLVLAPTHLWCQAIPAQNNANKPISVLSWLVGGTWKADASKIGPGLQRIETSYQWSDNQAYLRFTTHFVADKGTQRKYDGSFYWDPRESSLKMWYMDPSNSITQGPVSVNGDITQIVFRGEDFEGKPADLRVNIIRKAGDHYTWLLEEKESQGWKQLLALDYFRVGVP